MLKSESLGENNTNISPISVQKSLSHGGTDKKKESSPCKSTPIAYATPNGQPCKHMYE